MKQITVEDISFPLFEGDIGVSVSGGTDSALMLYLLMTNMPKDQHLHIFLFAKKSMHYSCAIFGRRIVEIVSDLTGFVNYEIHIDYDFEAEETKELLFRNPASFLQGGKMSCLYTGITANPPIHIAQSFVNFDPVVHERRDPSSKRDVMLFPKVCTPLINHNKKDIARVYAKLGLMGSIFPHTLSCVNDDPKYLGTLCGECWWCHERKWGFGRLK